MRVNYTTYNVWRDYNTINLCSQCFYMLKSFNSDKQPYWYAQVLGIYYA